MIFRLVIIRCLSYVHVGSDVVALDGVIAKCIKIVYHYHSPHVAELIEVINSSMSKVNLTLVSDMENRSAS